MDDDDESAKQLALEWMVKWASEARVRFMIAQERDVWPGHPVYVRAVRYVQQAIGDGWWE